MYLLSHPPPHTHTLEQGLTHTGGISCRVDDGGVVQRDPVMCTPDWYGDRTSFMGWGASLQLPNAIRYKVRRAKGVQRAGPKACG
jgi:hypothetical protein